MGAGPGVDQQGPRHGRRGGAYSTQEAEDVGTAGDVGDVPHSAGCVGALQWIKGSRVEAGLGEAALRMNLRDLRQQRRSATQYPSHCHRGAAR